MADGALTIELEDDLADQVKNAAAARGVSFAMFFRDALANHLVGEMIWTDDPDPAIDADIAEEASRTGECGPVDDVVAWMRSWFTPGELPMPTAPKP
jgi:predicted transcriptional regulator